MSGDRTEFIRLMLVDPHKDARTLFNLRCGCRVLVSTTCIDSSYSDDHVLSLLASAGIEAGATPKGVKH